MDNLSVGSIVRCRGREWVVLPSDSEILLLRPLTGGEEEVCGVHKRLMNLLPWERVEPAQFPLPKPEDVGDAVGAELLWNAARLTIRDGAGPFRSLGRISVRPRPYQFVPLLMSLRLQPVRLLIADDVGVGKTIEALLIARELLDRGEIKRLCVLCPPYLCDQWQSELWEKYHIDAVVIRSGTIGQLERQLPSGDHSIFGYFPYIVVSIDYAKSERHRSNFLIHCPEFVIVDEAHGTAQPPGGSRSQQQRHELLKEIAADPNRHLILLTATPHSGVEDSFLSLLGLIREDFRHLNLQSMSERERDDLAKHFVQRRRADVKGWLGEETPFPERETVEESYVLSPPYRRLFERVYEFSRELVRSGETLTGWRRRIRYWTALAILRCVMSSPAAAIATLRKRASTLAQAEEDTSDESYSPYIYEPTDEETVDVQPTHIVEDWESSLEEIGYREGERRRLLEFARLAEKLMGSEDDTKLIRCCEIVRDLLREGYKPIVWCRYIPTSDYVAEELQRRLEDEFQGLRVISITGALAEEERRERVAELAQFPYRVLVATDCLSEGINLQEHFTAVLHYDLPWNPNRLEQREGRVDRFGQTAKKVKAVLFYGRDNPVDGAVLDVLLRKAKEIHRTLGISVPVPMESEKVMEAVLEALFLRGPQAQQLLLFDDPLVRNVHRRWDEVANREKESRTRFAQRAIKPDEVDRELREADSVLGDPDAVRRFVINACQRLGITVHPDRDGAFLIADLDRLPEMVRSSAPDAPEWRVTFTTPAPENATYLGRNHPFVSALARFLLEESLTKGGEAHLPRCGVIRTSSVPRRTVLLLLRLRFMIEEPDKDPMLAEEVLVCGLRVASGEWRVGNEESTTRYSQLATRRFTWLDENDALRLLSEAKPDANVTPSERREVLEEVLEWWDELQPDLEEIIDRRAEKLRDTHRRVRASAKLIRRGMNVRPHLPPDLLGVLVLLPIPRGIRGQRSGVRDQERN